MAKKVIMAVALLNPLAFYPGFNHVSEQIFGQLDNKSLSNCREVSSSWHDCIDNKKLSWIRIVNIPGILQNCETYLIVAAKTGQSFVFKIGKSNF